MTDDELSKVVFTDIFNKRKGPVEKEEVEEVAHGLFFKIAFTVLGLLAVVAIMPFMILMGVIYGLVGAYESLVGIKELWFK